MATFIHIFPEKDKVKILDNGIKIIKSKSRDINGVYVSPVTEDYNQTHQWVREVQRTRNFPKLAARVRIPDDEPVYIGKYNEEHLMVSAVKAIAIARDHEDPGGLELIVPRPIRANEIIKVYRPSKNVGWRYYPKAKGKKPCGCPYCQRGEPGAKKLRAKYEQDE